MMGEILAEIWKFCEQHSVPMKQVELRHTFKLRFEQLLFSIFHSSLLGNEMCVHMGNLKL